MEHSKAPDKSEEEITRNAPEWSRHVRSTCHYRQRVRHTPENELLKWRKVVRLDGRGDEGGARVTEKEKRDDGGRRKWGSEWEEPSSLRSPLQP
ncbi:hypothetical protein CJ030_MR6G011326 [Morella rubra]|uniref:Uncharacterized protein n=1 Tax=Morella rubra TaxID=262757 RepID=A0A6A1VE22_9ROSI|nr:hypothetical protein CJ030_MR6G011326 [Morella rubra]